MLQWLRKQKNELENKSHYTDPEARALIEELGARRLRAIPHALLGTIAANYRLWRPLVEVLAGARRTTPDLNAELKDLRKQVVNVVGGRRKGGDRGPIEDAVQDAITSAIKVLRDPDRGYTYEGGLLAWLASAALNRLKAGDRHPQTEPLPEDVPGDPPENEDIDAAAVLEEWRARYLLRRDLFQRRIPPASESNLRVDASRRDKGR